MSTIEICDDLRCRECYRCRLIRCDAELSGTRKRLERLVEAVRAQQREYVRTRSLVDTRIREITRWLAETNEE